jgi:N-acetylglucosaminyldiphosphoundecaprenol N-acetyl-beta-D-mannosaminyltransferase
MNSRRKIFLGVPVDLGRPDEFISRIEASLSPPVTQTLLAVNPEKIMQSRKDRELAAALESADFLIPDGIGVIVGLKLLYGRRIKGAVRIAGIELMESLLRFADRAQKKVFLFGGSAEVNVKAAQMISHRYPSLVLVGHRHGYGTGSADEALVREIGSLGADILFVGLGSPKQEKWIQKHRNELKAGICMGVGGSFDVLVGKISRAPKWMRKAGLEWMFRLFREPGRTKRQLALPRFALELLKEKINLR